LSDYFVNGSAANQTALEVLATLVNLLLPRQLDGFVGVIFQTVKQAVGEKGSFRFA
jgi:hypothetical protein